MIVEVTDVVRPIGLFDTIIKFKGISPDGEIVTFGVDHRPARDLFEAVKEAAEYNDPPVMAEVESWQILKTKCNHLAIQDQDRTVCTFCGIELSI